ncbi:unnamed protein product [Owenia fusiformis]|uniref:Uncharacterized protein n=1 Tax=Owenia fusiformis TaxID=6347 RepID=A0A8J1TQJ9_OWEFU|nr:unnamed protein product [Owenia fusiformis]
MSGQPTTINLSNWRIEDVVGGLAADFDGSMSGLGVELGGNSTAYNMSEALLALPVFKQENMENGYQYIMSAATSPATKLNEETLTYLNQGQSYEVKLKKLGEDCPGKLYRSVIKVAFHDRRLQYMEKEQIDNWKCTRPGDRLLDIDIPLSYGLNDVRLDATRLNAAEFIWDPSKPTGIYIRIHCISTEFTPKKHGGEKGVPFRIQVETYTHTDPPELLHCASCQVKVFKPKGADRKHKTDREKMGKRSEAEKEKYQPSYECTVLTEVPLDMVQPNERLGAPLFCDNPSPVQSPGPSPLAPIPGPSTSFSGNRSPSLNSLEANYNPSPQESTAELLITPLSPDFNSAQVASWMQQNRFNNYIKVFQYFSGADLLRLTRDDLIQICGLADGIRLNNALQLKAIRPRLTIYVCQESEQVYHAVYLEHLSTVEITEKFAELFSITSDKIVDIYAQGPSGIHILVTDEVLQNITDQSRYAIETIKADQGDNYRILLKCMDQ